jgi:hypothetical protein
MDLLSLQMVHTGSDRLHAPTDVVEWALPKATGEHARLSGGAEIEN